MSLQITADGHSVYTVYTAHRHLPTRLRKSAQHSQGLLRTVLNNDKNEQFSNIHKLNISLLPPCRVIYCTVLYSVPCTLYNVQCKCASQVSYKQRKSDYLKVRVLSRESPSWPPLPHHHTSSCSTSLLPLLRVLVHYTPSVFSISSFVFFLSMSVICCWAKTQLFSVCPFLLVWAEKKENP